LKCGVVQGYGTSTAENDFNTYAEFYYLERYKLDAFAEQYPQIKIKYELFKRIMNFVR
jgi:hypothetical protein